MTDMPSAHTVTTAIDNSQTLFSSITKHKDSPWLLAVCLGTWSSLLSRRLGACITVF